MPLRHSSWKEHLLAKSNSVEGLTGNENFGSFPAATAKTTIQADALLKNLTEEGSVLLAATDDSKKLTLLHQLKNFGEPGPALSTRVSDCLLSAKLSANCIPKLGTALHQWASRGQCHTATSLIRPLWRIFNGLEATDMVS